MEVMTTATIRTGPAEPVRYRSLYDPEPVATTVHLDGRRYAVTAEVTYKFKGPSGDGRAFVDGAPDPIIPVPPSGYSKGDHPDVDAAWRVYNGAEERIRRIALEALVVGQWRWSRKAGCKCGCSPGFIATRTPRWDGQEIRVNLRPF